MSLHNNLHAQAISLASSRNCQGSMCPEFITALVNIRLSNAVSISRYLNPVLYPAPTCMKRPRTESFKLSSRAIWAINDCLILIGNRGHLMLLCSSSDSMKSLHRCSHTRNSSRIFTERLVPPDYTRNSSRIFTERLVPPDLLRLFYIIISFFPVFSLKKFFEKNVCF